MNDNFFKTYLRFLTISCLLLTAGCDRIYHLIHKEGAEEKEILGDIDILTDNKKIEEVQRILKIYGYTIGKVDGKMGPTTREAVKKFQEDNALSVTRFVDKATWDQLNDFTDIGFIEEGRLNIRTVQACLNQAGHYHGKIDGDFGPRTREAVKKFQKSRGLKPDGVVGFKTLKELAERNSKS